jgi:hypothetical protein
MIFSVHDLTWHVLHFFGIDTEASEFYNFWSGIGTQVPVLVSGFLYLRHQNCRTKRCWRLGHHDPVTHHPACKKHHSHRHMI